MNMAGKVTDSQTLLEIQANCRELGKLLHRNGWDADKMAALRTPEVQAAVLATMAFIEARYGLLADCQRQFGKDKSRSVERAFDYIDIYLNRGPEALEQTVGLVECLTLEVAQPGVAKPCRELTFIQQLGRWAQKLAAQKNLAVAARGATGQMRRKKGRKKLPPKEEKRRLGILARWKRASGTIPRRAFCDDEGIELKDLENFQRWAQQRENRGQ